MYLDRREAAYLEVFLQTHGLVIGMQYRHTYYWMWNACEGETDVDGRFADQPVGKWMIFEGNHAIGFDLESIE